MNRDLLGGDRTMKRGNLLWEGSRMMLPEHRESLIKHREQERLRSRAELNIDQLELLAYELMSAYQEGYPARITEFHACGDIQHTGRITKIDQVLRRIKIEQEDGAFWLELDNIVKIEKA
jgi:hypothetical protein